MKMKTMQVAFSSLVAIFLGLAIINLVWVLDEQEKYMKDPDAIVHHDGKAMTARQHLLTVRYPEGSVGPLSHLLLEQPLWLNWGSLYVMTAILGWCGSVWLRAYHGKEMSDFFVSLLLAGLAGACAYLLVKIVMTLVPRLSELSYALTLVAIAGGLFVSTFYDELELLMKACSKYLRKKLGDDDKKRNPKDK